MSLISVIVPVYNVEAYLRRCVDSILAQSFVDFELILVDDGSEDNCGIICDEYAEQDSRVQVIHQENGGLSAARNAGIDWLYDNSDSQWLMFVDSDDWIHPRMLEWLYGAVSEHCVKVVICGRVETEGEVSWPKEDKTTTTIWSAEECYAKEYADMTTAHGKLYHRQCFEGIHYPVGKIHEDEYVTYKVLFDCGKIAVINEPLYAYYINLQGIMRSKWSLRRLDAIPAIEQQRDYFKKNDYIHAYEKCRRRLVLTLAHQIKLIRQADISERKRNKALDYVRKKLRRELWHNVDVFPLRGEHLWLYELAFPRLLAAFWYSQVIKKKLLELIGR